MTLNGRPIEVVTTIRKQAPRKTWGWYNVVVFRYTDAQGGSGSMPAARFNQTVRP